MYRVVYFLAIIFVPITFSWWLFIPMALLSVYLFKLPYEIILAGIILDLLYYFGDGFFARNLLVIFSLIVMVLAYFLSERIYWSRVN